DPDETIATTVSGAPAGVVLSEIGRASCRERVGSTAVDVSIWTLSALTVTADSAHDGQFTLTVKSTATDADAFSSDSASTSHNILVTVNEVADAPIVTVAATASGAEDTATAIPRTVSSGE